MVYSIVGWLVWIPASFCGMFADDGMGRGGYICVYAYRYLEDRIYGVFTLMSYYFVLCLQD